MPNVLQVNMTFRELKPEVANARTEPVPVAPRAVDPAPPTTVLNQPDLVRLTEVERALADAYHAWRHPGNRAVIGLTGCGLWAIMPV